MSEAGFDQIRRVSKGLETHQQQESLQQQLDEIRSSLDQIFNTLKTLLSDSDSNVSVASEILSFVAESLEDEDEANFEIAKTLCMITQAGFPRLVECCADVIKPLEILCASEEQKVRDKAVEGLVSLTQHVCKNSLAMEQIIIPLILRMTSHEWVFCRASSCHLVASLYYVLPVLFKPETREIFVKLCRDVSPVVRRAAIIAMRTYASRLEATFLKSNLIPSYLSLSDDDQDSVRLLAVQTCISLAKLSKDEDGLLIFLPAYKKYLTDPSWRVRYMAALHFKEACEVLKPSNILKEGLLELYLNLSSDIEPEVRSMAAGKVADVCLGAFGVMDSHNNNNDSYKPSLVKDIIPSIRKFASDKSPYVRAAFASVAMSLAPIMGKDISTDYLLPVYLQLLADENSDVRLKIISNVEKAAQVVGVDLLSGALHPAVVELAADKQWRVRLAMIDLVPGLASQLGTPFFTEKLTNLCISWLSDSVYSIREAATLNLKQLAKAFGPAWTEVNLITRIINISTNSNNNTNVPYLNRLTCLFAISILCDVMTKEITSSKLLPIVLRFAGDNVANIRFNVAKTLKKIIPLVENELVQGTIKPVLMKLLQDTDKDVRHYAADALSLC